MPRLPLMNAEWIRDQRMGCRHCKIAQLFNGVSFRLANCSFALIAPLTPLVTTATLHNWRHLATGEFQLLYSFHSYSLMFFLLNKSHNQRSLDHVLRNFYGFWNPISWLTFKFKVNMKKAQNRPWKFYFKFNPVWKLWRQVERPLPSHFNIYRSIIIDSFNCATFVCISFCISVNAASLNKCPFSNNHHNS